MSQHSGFEFYKRKPEVITLLKWSGIRDSEAQFFDLRGFVWLERLSILPSIKTPDSAYARCTIIGVDNSWLSQFATLISITRNLSGPWRAAVDVSFNRALHDTMFLELSYRNMLIVQQIPSWKYLPFLTSRVNHSCSPIPLRPPGRSRSAKSLYGCLPRMDEKLR